MPKFSSLKPKIKTAYLGIKPTQDRQAHRALNTGSAQWRRIRQSVLVRDGYRCAGYPRGKHSDGCNGFANEVDHIDGDCTNDAADGSNYQSLSKHCHSSKTASEMNNGILRSDNH